MLESMEKKVLYFEFPGPPIHQERARNVIRHGQRIWINPNAKQKEDLQKSVAVQMLQSSRKPFKCPVSVQMIFEVSIPASHSIKLTKSLYGVFCDKRPDIDNYIKFYLDILDGVAIDDDKQVVCLESRKIYSAEPKTVIWITEH